MKFLLFFIDGLGLGLDDKIRNPLAHAAMPHLQTMLGGKRLVLDTILLKPKGQTDISNYGRLDHERTTLLALDVCLGIDGLPQSATSQAALLTGQNVPAALGYHQGPKPNSEVSRFLRDGSLFNALTNTGHSVALLNAYPPQYFAGIESGRRVQGAISLAVTNVGIPLKTSADLFAGQAISADFTAQAWREYLDFPDAPILGLHQAGERLAALSQLYDFALFEFWMSDYIGHRQNLPEACALLETFDQVLGGLLDAWNDEQGLILITSDHGNIEDLSTRRHTINPVPALIVGAPHLRHPFSAALNDLTDVAPAIIHLFEQQ